MANNKMLIDASHPEETRVVVVKGNRIEEFDFESQHKKQLKGNIYLAKVTRVEPSLQAAFVDYGGNRHGFLAFSEIHPDYYQIPMADRQALIEEELARAQEDDDSDAGDEPAKPARKPRRSSKAAKAARAKSGDSVSESVASDPADGSSAEESSDNSSPAEAATDSASSDAPVSEDSRQGDALNAPADFREEGGDDSDAAEATEAGSEDKTGSEDKPEAPQRSSRRRSERRRRSAAADSEESDEESHEEEAEEVDEIGAEDAMEEVPVRQSRPRRQYKIQEVIKRRQILLVQVVKEERGNKGAALTTYLSLAGRYSVLMPNTARGGGISRKITNATDRKRLKEVARDLKVPQGMGVILRTAGANRTKPEIKRDFEYLMRLWETVRTVTLSSSAPALVYEEGSLIKRSIRDLYNRDIDEILVAGEDAYREAKDFMRMLMPSQAKVVQPYREATPIFARQGIEAQLDRMLQPHVTLKSGGYIIINQTEALVAIDVNSGRSTREHSIEDTAFQTNLEAAEEIARQLRLRDLAGLIVIDFIDMEEKRNNRAVEKKLKDCLKDDRARIQLGRISHFGLMEMSRQRIRASVLESTTQVCPVCEGVGYIRSDSSLALHVLRHIEEHLHKHSDHDIVVKVPTATALYILNEKRGTIAELEAHHGVRITIEADETHGRQSVVIERGAEATRPTPKVEPAHLESVVAEDVEEEEEEVISSGETPSDDDNERGDNGNRRRKRRRKRRRGDEDSGNGAEDEQQASGDASDGDDDAGDDDSSQDDDQGRGRRRRRRGRRGGRRNRDDLADGEVSTEAGEGQEAEAVSDGARVSSGEQTEAPSQAEAPVHAEVSSGTDEPSTNEDEAAPSAIPATADALVDAPEATQSAVETQDEVVGEEAKADAVENSARADETPTEQAPSAPVGPKEPQVTTGSGDTPSEDKPKRTGWWSRRGFL
ncbi:RNAse E [Consotaella salsifontis]|uniref:Ribonuclease E n=1 Tax=Consotaella salsifontis TaxID=1365950 RepID=A0A1T4LQJ3_9HYPH|nr:Rne/Rng family ribonuclease [Consotaella salsifontis]SJZ57002.1 RNAse E [Consotaella salsifontis]